MRKGFILVFISLLSWQFYSQDSIAVDKKEFIPQVDTTYIQKKAFDSDLIEEFKKSEDFIYEIEEKEPGLLQRFWNWVKESVKSFLRFLFDDINPAVGLLKNFLRILPYIILAIGLFFIIKYFANVSSRSILEGKNESLANFSNDEELLKRQDLQDLLAEAIDKKDYRLAIRFYYLIILQKLRDAQVIDWQQQKTNEDYILEIAQKPYQQDFINTTRLYDFVWYGKFEIDESEFQKADESFKKLTRKIV